MVGDPAFVERLAINMIRHQKLLDRLAGSPHRHHSECIHNLPPDEQIALRGRTRDWWERMGLAIPEQITPEQWVEHAE